MKVSGFFMHACAALPFSISERGKRKTKETDNYSHARQAKPWSALLGGRVVVELEVVRALAVGDDADEIAERLALEVLLGQVLRERKQKQEEK